MDLSAHLLRSSKPKASGEAAHVNDGRHGSFPGQQKQQLDSGFGILPVTNLGLNSIDLQNSDAFVTTAAMLLASTYPPCVYGRKKAKHTTTVESGGRRW